MNEPIRLPTATEIRAMDADSVAYYSMKMEECRRWLQERASELGASELWLLGPPTDAKHQYAWCTKIQTIKLIRHITGIGLREAKLMADAAESGTPQLVSRAISRDNVNAQALAEFAAIEWRASGA